MERREAGKAQRLGAEPVGGRIFCCCLQSVISLMKWPMTQGNIAMDGNVRKRRTRMSFAFDPAAFEMIDHFISEI